MSPRDRVNQQIMGREFAMVLKSLNVSRSHPGITFSVKGKSDSGHSAIMERSAEEGMDRNGQALRISHLVILHRLIRYLFKFCDVHQ